ncbi:histone deacetylase family protein [Thermodesulfatator autotrophicus]|uniref:Histone deacetylase domain-containing protein n=1 Tax=Thermodesulfatator autotrophicus TaxID=1795632 RepID=A0A177E4F3_9BACT|nr:histone deacetylase [Thermodesulfatator autotrophicus]OAG26795.1 hypothetical protein TH606_10400 [Thermodesulfatator autotrophicus]
MRKTLPVIFSPDFQYHRTSPQHPEKPERLDVIMKRLKEGLLGEIIKIIEPSPAPLEWVKEVHDSNYLLRFEEACLRGRSFICGKENEICYDTYEIAFIAAGAVLKAVDLVEKGEKFIFCPVRPPGHHAERYTALGFCFLNNVAIGARYWQKNYGRRILIIDWDAHHGNGIQNIFYEDDEVFYVSIHENPRFSFPGTGLPEEKGRGRGEGYNLNIPLSLDSGDVQFIEAFLEKIEPVVKEFKPEGLIIAAGFDAHQDDDMAYLNVTTAGFAEASEIVRQWSEEFDFPVISVLEGGYNLDILPVCVAVHLKAMLDLEAEDPEDF